MLVICPLQLLTCCWMQVAEVAPVSYWPFVQNVFYFCILCTNVQYHSLKPVKNGIYFSIIDKFMSQYLVV